MPNEALTITLDADHKADLERIARTQGREPGTLVAEAIAHWLDLQAWQAKEIEAGLADAKADNFATREEVDAAYANR